MFIDESGLLMAPVLRRTWSPRGQCPVVVQRTRAHQKVSVIAALALSASRRRVRLCFRMHIQRSIRSPQVVAFLRQLTRQLRGPVVIVWDRLQAHRSLLVGAWAARQQRVHFALLPPYAPELNPVEYAWSWLKTNPLANYAPTEAPRLARVARHHARDLQRRPELLWSFLAHTHLPFCRK